MKPTVFSTASSPVRSRTDDGHGVAGHEQQGEEHHAADGRHQELDVAHLLHEGGHEGLLGLGARLPGRVREARRRWPSATCDRVRARRRRAPMYQPTKSCAHVGRLLLQVVPAEPELREVVAGAACPCRCPRTLNSQSPGKIAPLMGMRSPTFQPKRSAVASPTMAPCLSARKACHWSSGTRNSGYMLPVGLVVDGELGEEVLLVLVHAAEPVGEGRPP